jgi:hypothetical protein
VGREVWVGEWEGNGCVCKREREREEGRGGFGDGQRRGKTPARRGPPSAGEVKAHFLSKAYASAITPARVIIAAMNNPRKKNAAYSEQ